MIDQSYLRDASRNLLANGCGRNPRQVQSDVEHLGGNMGTIIFVLIGMVAANFLYQAVNDRDFSLAMERSYFQAIALGLVAFFQWMNA